MNEQRPEPKWKMVRVDPHEGGRIRLLSVVIDGQRVYCEEHYAAADHNGDRQLLHQRYWTRSESRSHRTLEAALAAETEPVESNEP